MAAIDTLRDALFGNPPVPGWKPSREGVLKAFEELEAEIDLLTVGIASYATVADLPAGDPNGSQGRVYADATAANNTFWLKKAGVWGKDVDLIASIATIVQPLVDAAAASAAAAASSAASLASFSSKFSVVVNGVDESGSPIRFAIKHKPSGALLLWMDTNFDVKIARGTLAVLSDVPVALLSHFSYVTNTTDEAGNVIRFAIKHKPSGALIFWVANDWSLHGLRQAGSELATLADIPALPTYAVIRTVSDILATMGSGNKWQSGAILTDGTFAVGKFYNRRDPEFIMIDMPTFGQDIRIMNRSQQIAADGQQSDALVEWVFPKYSVPGAAGGVDQNLRQFNSVWAATQKGESSETTRGIALMNAGESGVVAIEGSYQSGANAGKSYDNLGVVSSTFIGGSAHGNEYSIAMGPKNTATGERILIDGRNYRPGVDVTRRLARRADIILKTAMVRARSPLTVFNGSNHAIEIRKQWTMTRNGLRSRHTIWFKEDFTGQFYIELLCLQVTWLEQMLDGIIRKTDNSSQMRFPFVTVDTDYPTTWYQYSVSGIKEMIYTNEANGSCCILRPGQLNFYASGDYPQKTTPCTQDLFWTRTDGGYHKTYRIAGGLAVDPATVNGDTAVTRFPAGSILDVTDTLEFLL